MRLAALRGSSAPAVIAESDDGRGESGDSPPVAGPGVINSPPANLSSDGEPAHRVDGRARAGLPAGPTERAAVPALDMLSNSGTRGVASRSQRPRSTKARVKLASLNMRGLGPSDATGMPDKWMRINQIVRDSKIAILAIQEAHLECEKADQLNELFSSSLKVYASPDPVAPGAAKGVAFVLNRRLIDVDESVITQVLVPGCAMTISVPWGVASRMSLLNVYAPNVTADNAAFWDQLTSASSLARLRNVDAMMGDFNIVEEPVDRVPARPDPEVATSSLAALCRALHMHDGWREESPGVRAFSFLQSATGIANYNAPFVGKGRWVVPLTILTDPDFMSSAVAAGIKLQQAINAITDRTQSVNPQSLYQAFKSEIRDLARARTKELFAKWDKKISALREDIHTVLNRPESQNAAGGPTHNTASAAILQQKLSKLESRRFEKRRDDLKTRQWLEGETMSRSWIRQSKLHSPQHPFYELRSPGQAAGQYLNQTRSMVELAKVYYDGIQCDDRSDLDVPHEEAIRATLEVVAVRLNSAQKEALGRRLSAEDTVNAVMGAAGGKASGLDGLPAELWQALAQRFDWDMKAAKPAFNVVGVLRKVFNDVEREGVVVGSTFAEGWICPIYKLKGDKCDISNYRPITVLNADYKMFTKALTVKLAECVEGLIHPDQAGFVHGRKIHDNVKLTKLILDYAEAEEVEGAIVALDQEKAYDKIDHAYLWAVLRRMNFPECFIATVRTLYGAAESTVMLNGVISSRFRIVRGVRQGDPLSCLLFNLAIEPLACALRQSSLKGISIPGLASRLITTLFADDTTVFLSAADNYADLWIILDGWCRAARARFNASKTELIPIGPKTYRESVSARRTMSPDAVSLPPSLRILREGEATRSLGAWVGSDFEQATPWGAVTETIRGNLERWAKRNPTLQGKRLILNMEGMPRTVEDSLTKMMSEFVWDGGKPRVDKCVLADSLSQGGLKLLDLRARNEAINLMWLCSYLDLSPTRPRWAFVAHALLANAIAAVSRSVERNAMVNTFLQTWDVSTRVAAGLPQDLKRMIQAAKKYNVRVDSPNPQRALIDALPIWYHFGLDEGRSTANSPASRCLRANHRVVTVADCLRVSAKLSAGSGHCPVATCVCAGCIADREVSACPNPHRCACAALKAVEQLEEKWRPTDSLSEDGLSLTRRRVEMNRVAAERGDALLFDPSVSQGAPVGHAFRVFAKDRMGGSVAARRAPRPFQVADEMIEVFTDGSCSQNGAANAAAGAGAWFGEDDPRNTAARVPGPLQSNQTGEVYAVVLAAAGTPPFVEMTINTDSKYLYNGLTRDLPHWEDRGWIGVANKDLLCEVAVRLRSRSARTWIKWVKGHAGTRGNEEADRLAACGADMPAVSDASSQISRPEFLVQGARLSALTQRLAYKGIVSWKPRKERARTQRNIGMIQAALCDDYKLFPTERHIWLCVWNRTISRRASSFFWKAIHGAYKIGTYWDNIPGYEQRALCCHCGTPEDMDHILLECDAPGRRELWELADTLLRRKGVVLPPPCYGAVLGAPALSLEGLRGEPAPAADRAVRIVLVETLHLIWKVRCERVIEREGDPERLHSLRELQNKWYAVINGRLSLDVALTKKKWGRRKIGRLEVLRTWAGMLQDEESLPEDWIDESGVLLRTSWKRQCKKDSLFALEHEKEYREYRDKLKAQSSPETSRRPSMSPSRLKPSWRSSVIPTIPEDKIDTEPKQRVAPQAVDGWSTISKTQKGGSVHRSHAVYPRAHQSVDKAGASSHVPGGSRVVQKSNKTSTQSAASTIASRTGPIRGGKNTLARFANRFSALQKKSIGDA
ncbi:hypothetical protein VTO73DRAFT_2353 [Trametes versicolor]